MYNIKFLMPFSVITAGWLLMSPAVADQVPRVDFYGRLKASLLEEDSNGKIVNNASLVGLKGQIELDTNLNFIYQVEYETNPFHLDSGDKRLKQRNSYLGVKGRYGTLLVGKYDTPTKISQGKLDLFNDLVSDLKSIIDGENRLQDVVLYTSPEYRGFQASLQAIEEGRLGSFSLGYKNQDVVLRLAVDNDIANRDVIRLTTQVFLGNLTLGGLYQRSEDTRVSNARKESGVFLNAAYKLDKFTWKLQLGESDQKSPGKTQVAAGIDYQLSSQARLFGYYTGFDADAVNQDRDYYGVGIEYKF